MSTNTYEQLVSKAKELDYIVGPGMKFMVQGSMGKTHKSELEKICGCSGSTNISCEDYNLSLLADFLYNLDKQVSQNMVIGHGNPDALALYFKSKDKLSKGSDSSVEYISTDKSGNKYITLTEKGVELFRDIWNSGRSVCYSDTFIPFSRLADAGFNVTNESMDLLDGEKSLLEQQATLVKNTNGPSILVQNSLKSAGFTEEYSAPDESIIGSRKSLKGSYLTRNGL